MKSTRCYLKPQIQYWPASKLDAIEASMSGGGGVSIRVKWEDYWTDSGLEGDYSLIVDVVLSVLVSIATKRLSSGKQILAELGVPLATAIVDNNIKPIYYSRSIQHLYMFDGYTSAGEVWSLLGSAIKTEYYADSAHTEFLGTLEWNNVPSMFAYALASLRW